MGFVVHWKNDKGERRLVYNLCNYILPVFKLPAEKARTDGAAVRYIRRFSCVKFEFKNRLYKDHDVF